MEIKNQTLLQLNQPDSNGLTFTTEVVQEMLDRWKYILPIYGTLDHICGCDDNISVSDYSHIVNNIRIENDKVMGDITTLETPKGQILNSIMEASKQKPNNYGKFQLTMWAHFDSETLQVRACDIVSVDFTVLYPAYKKE